MIMTFALTLRRLVDTKIHVLLDRALRASATQIFETAVRTLHHYASKTKMSVSDDCLLGAVLLYKYSSSKLN